MIPKPETILQIIGQQPYNEVMLVDRQDTEDIVEAILSKHEACTGDYDKFAYLFDGGTVPDICRRLWQFCRTYLDYNVESTKAQFTSKPSTILKRGYSDCKCFALFCGGVLDALSRSGEKIDWCFRFASYKLFSKKPYHVFIVVRYYGTEIYIDPVFSQFDYRKPGMWLTDYDVSVRPASIAGMVCDSSGQLNVLTDGDTCAFPHDGFRQRSDGLHDAQVGLSSSTGATITKLTGAAAPYLATIPVVGWVAIGVGSLAGALITIFGDKFKYSSDVRGLIQKYQYFVLNQPAVTQASKANENLKAQAQQWFSAVLGVPIYDDLRYDALRGEDHTTFSDLPNRWDYNARVQLYKSFGPAEVAQPDALVLQAAYIADTLDDRTAGSYPTKPGAWAGALAAPNVTAAGDTAAGTGVFSSFLSNKWLMIAIIGAALVMVVSSKPKRKTKNKKR